jgi:hypothetical protein
LIEEDNFKAFLLCLKLLSSKDEDDLHVNKDQRRALTRETCNYATGSLCPGDCMLLLVALVWKRIKAALATDQLIQFKQEEVPTASLTKIEQQSILLHENLISGWQKAPVCSHGLDINMDVLKDQTDELYNMTTKK